ncbi:hypothetical protein CLV85_0855 [Salinibacterium amurskyense]|uniref:Copper(I)-binding protein n=1 Tax=Salinibacterium amurskyense TaxID=205941 RepID=A0A2M9D7H1_9MICO|nr:hypothetical protein [Salinibacterium amurskyense]PJJ81677.1 hypothetical protein CLV85_0855 [Salinibacterium amurskyense]RLQ83657.1 hypothetical protein D9C83_04240 [Salinibacterium amurskyense]GHD79671.1 hypothetical protein GCM10007394_09600 [Salinibacterium amurskyense]
MTVRTRATRAAASALIAGALLVGTAGCSFITPTATLNHYDPSDGIGAEVGDVKVRNVLAISNDDESAVSLMVTIINTSSSSGSLRMQYESAEGERIDISKPVTSGEVKSYGTEVDGDMIVIADAGIRAGQLFPIYFQFGNDSGQELLVPVMASDDVIYADLAPASALSE